MPINKFNPKPVSKNQETFKFNELDYEDDKILKEFQMTMSLLWDLVPFIRDLTGWFVK